LGELDIASSNRNLRAINDPSNSLIPSIFLMNRVHLRFMYLAPPLTQTMIVIYVHLTVRLWSRSYTYNRSVALFAWIRITDGWKCRSCYNHQSVILTSEFVFTDRWC